MELKAYKRLGFHTMERFYLLNYMLPSVNW
jgi:hypothetical protein